MNLTAASSLSMCFIFIACNSFLNSDTVLFKLSTRVSKTYFFSGIFIVATPFSNNSFSILKSITFSSSLNFTEYFSF